MVDDVVECEKELRELCILIIDKLDEMKARGVITEEEYSMHTKLKKRFLDSSVQK
jgi:hypothetical protein